jgi:long-chain acyl-CoA synthetase
MTKHWLKHYDPEVPHHIDYPRIPVYQLLEDTAAKYPDRPSVRFYGKQFTFRQIQELSDRFAAGLRSLGVAKGDRVGILLPNCPQYVIAYYGILKAGAVVVPLNPLYTARELTFHFENSGAETVVTIPLFLEKITEVREQAPLNRVICSCVADFLPFPISTVQGMRERRLINGSKYPGFVHFKDLLQTPIPQDGIPVAVDPDEMAVLIYSGGTTGIAKGIMLSHYNIVANAHQAVAWGSLDTEARMLAVLPLFHGFGMSVWPGRRRSWSRVSTPKKWSR